MARASGISRTTLKRARKKLAVTAKKSGFRDGWELKLPDPTDATSPPPDDDDDDAVKPDRAREAAAKPDHGDASAAEQQRRKPEQTTAESGRFKFFGTHDDDICEQCGRGKEVGSVYRVCQWNEIKHHLLHDACAEAFYGRDDPDDIAKDD